MHKRAKSASSCVLKVKSKLSKEEVFDIKKKLDQSFQDLRTFITYVPCSQKTQEKHTKLYNHYKSFSNVVQATNQTKLKRLFKNQQLSKSFLNQNKQNQDFYQIKKISQIKLKSGRTFYNPYIFKVKKAKPVVHLKHRSLIKELCQQEKNFNFSNYSKKVIIKKKQQNPTRINIKQSSIQPSKKLVKKKKQYKFFKID